MKTIIILLTWLLLPASLTASPRWNRDNYKVIDHKNFRKAEAFNKKIDYSHIDYGLVNAAVFYLTNEQREKKRLKPLEYAPALEVMAWNHSVQMAGKKFFSHTNFKDKKRRDTDDRARLAGITNPSIAENIAYSTEDPQTYLEVAEMLVDLWMHSKGHKENILSKSALQLGCGAYYYKGSWYGTQNFQWFKKVEMGNDAVDELP